MTHDPHDAAERIERRTQRILWASGIIFIAWQAAFFLYYRDTPPTGRAVDQVRSIAFVAWCGALLMLVATGGGQFASRAVRELLDDEVTLARRAIAYRNGFWAMIALAFTGYAVAQVTAVSALLLAHLTISAGVLVAVATLAIAGRRG